MAFSSEQAAGKGADVLAAYAAAVVQAAAVVELAFHLTRLCSGTE